MRVFLYGMQSSGASLITYFLAQKKGMYAMVDNFNGYVLPEMPKHVKNIVAKCTVNPSIRVADHVSRFRPDVKILILRNPVQNYISLSRKPYGTNIDRKFEVIDEVFANRDFFDLVITYEEFVSNVGDSIDKMKSIGIDAEIGYLDFKRSRDEMRRFNDKCAELRSYSRYGFGNMRGESLGEYSYDYHDDDIERMSSLCPRIMDFYRGE